MAAPIFAASPAKGAVMQLMLAVLLTLVSHAGFGADEAALTGPPASGVPQPGGSLGQPETTVVWVENFRFCARACRADSVAYLRTPTGPVPGTDNPRAVIYMQAGSPLTWRSRPAVCDVVGCGAHDLRLEDGTAEGRRIGVLDADTGDEHLGWTVPADAAPETIIRYFCAHHVAVGMTGAFQVLPVRVLSVSTPKIP